MKLYSQFDHLYILYCKSPNLFKVTDDSKHIKKRFECYLRSLENWSWRLLKEITWKRFTRVQPLLKNKDCNAKCWLVGRLKVYHTSIHLMDLGGCISVITIWVFGCEFCWGWDVVFGDATGLSSVLKSTTWCLPENKTVTSTRYTHRGVAGRVSIYSWQQRQHSFRR